MLTRTQKRKNVVSFLQQGRCSRYLSVIRGGRYCRSIRRSDSYAIAVGKDPYIFCVIPVTRLKLIANLPLSQCSVCAERVPTLRLHENAHGKCLACIDCIRNWAHSQLQETGVRRENSIRCLRCHLMLNDDLVRYALRNHPVSLARLEERLNGLRDSKGYHRCPRKGCFGGGFIPQSSWFSSPLTEAKCPVCDRCWTLARDPSTEVETATKNWISSECKACPKCEVMIERNKGCDHMICARCKEAFCWRCGLDYVNHNHSDCVWAARAASEQENMKKFVLLTAAAGIGFGGLVFCAKRASATGALTLLAVWTAAFGLHLYRRQNNH